MQTLQGSEVKAHRSGNEGTEADERLRQGLTMPVRSCWKDGCEGRGSKMLNTFLGFLLEDGEKGGPSPGTEKSRGEPALVAGRRGCPRCSEFEEAAVISGQCG